MKGWQNKQRRKQIHAGVFLFRLFSIMGYVILLAPFTPGAPLNNPPRQQVLYIMGIALVVLIVSNIIATKLGQSYPFETPRSEDIASDALGRAYFSKTFYYILGSIGVSLFLVMIISGATELVLGIFFGCSSIIILIVIALAFLRGIFR